MSFATGTCLCTTLGGPVDISTAYRADHDAAGTNCILARIGGPQAIDACRVTLRPAWFARTAAMPLAEKRKETSPT